MTIDPNFADLAAVAGDDDRADAIQEVAEDILNTLNTLPVADWGAALGIVVSSLINAKIDAFDMAQEAAAVERERYGTPDPLEFEKE